MQYSSWLKRVVTGVMGALAALVLATPVLASAYAATVYQTTKPLAVGSLTVLDHTNQPVAASENTGFSGVVTKQTKTTVDVADSGLVAIFVCDNDGAITSGDRIVLSPFVGVGARYHGSGTPIGVATESLPSSSSRWQATNAVRTTDGATKVRIAHLTIRLVTSGVTTAPAEKGVVASLQRIANGLAGHPVAIWQLMAAFVVGLGGLILAFGLLLSSGRASFLALGRNPLASSAILKGMWRIVGVSLGVLLAGVTIAYVILKVGG